MKNAEFVIRPKAAREKEIRLEANYRPIANPDVLSALRPDQRQSVALTAPPASARR